MRALQRVREKEVKEERVMESEKLLLLLLLTRASSTQKVR